MAKLSDNRVFFQKLITIGIPVVFQNLISLGLNLLDTLMIGMLGEQELAAVGSANQVFFIFNITLFGLYSGSAIYTAQYWGAGDIKGIHRILGMGYLTGTALAAVVTGVSLAFPEEIISLFSREPDVIALGADYLRIACLSYLFSGLSVAISYNSRAIQNLKVPTLINAMALGINAVLNYFLIFGPGPFPELGVKGAAIATLIARIAEFSALMGYVYTRKEHPFKTGFSELFGFNRSQFKRVMKMALPVVFTESSWALSVSLVFAAYGLIGTAALAVIQVANVVADMLQSVYFGAGNTTAMIIGETLGKGDKEGAYENAECALKLTGIFNVVITLFMMAIASPVANVYNFNPETTHLLIVSIIAMAVVITPRMYGYIFVVGILRAGGDTVFCMIVEVVSNLVIHVSVAYFAVLVLHAGLPAVIILGEATAGIVRGTVCYRRYKTKKWINIVTD